MENFLGLKHSLFSEFLYLIVSVEILRVRTNFAMILGYEKLLVDEE